jgi:hypothetical protein
MNLEQKKQLLKNTEELIRLELLRVRVLNMKMGLED